jgi:hypothetical protein
MIFRNAPAKHQRRRSRISGFGDNAHSIPNHPRSRPRSRKLISPFTVATLPAFAKQNGSAGVPPPSLTSSTPAKRQLQQFRRRNHAATVAFPAEEI